MGEYHGLFQLMEFLHKDRSASQIAKIDELCHLTPDLGGAFCCSISAAKLLSLTVSYVLELLLQLFDHGCQLLTPRLHLSTI